MKKIWLGALVLGVLVVPTILYILLTTGKHNITNVPHFGPKKPYTFTDKYGRVKNDTVYFSIPPYKLQGHNGKATGSEQLDGKIYVASFYQSACTDSCTKTIALLKELQDKLAREFRIKRGQVKLLSIALDAKTDSLPKLKATATRVGADAAIWTFANGDTATVYSLAQQGFLLNGFNPTPNAQGIVGHTHKLVLVDRERHIRGYFDGNSLADVNRLLEDIKTLIANYNLPKKGQQNLPKIEQHRN